MKKAVILLSGGLDSATILAIAKSQGFECHALSFSYGQKHEIELESAKKVAKSQNVESHTIAKIDVKIFNNSSLTDNIAVPKNQDVDNIKEIPNTYVPARNTLFLSYALSLAESIGAFDIFIGVNAVDYSGYPDCRPEFIESFEKMANLATKAGVENHKFRIQTPLISLSKSDIIDAGFKLGLDYLDTHSCYDPVLKDGGIYSCGQCDSCQLRLKGFREAGREDKIKYWPAGRSS